MKPEARRPKQKRQSTPARHSPKAQGTAPFQPVQPKAQEDKDQLRRRAGWFQRRTGGGC